MSRRMYAIYSERGSYSDYSRANVFLVETEALAIKITTAYNDIVQTVEHDYPIWQKEWLAAHPEPEYFLPERLVLPSQPTPDPFLKTISKKDRAVHPLQVYFKKQLEDWKSASEQMRERHTAQRVRSNEPHKLWSIEQSQAKEAYMNDKVHGMMVAYLGDDAIHEQVETWTKSNWFEVSFGYDELDVLGSP